NIGSGSSIALHQLAARTDFVRIVPVVQVVACSTVTFLNETWLIGKHWVGEYVRASINTARHQVSFLHKPDEETDWRCLQPRLFRIHEAAHNVAPALMRELKRRLDYLPSQALGIKIETMS